MAEFYSFPAFEEVLISVVGAAGVTWGASANVLAYYTCAADYVGAAAVLDFAGALVAAALAGAADSGPA